MSFTLLIDEFEEKIVKCSTKRESKLLCEEYSMDIFLLHDEIYDENSKLKVKMRDFLIKLFSEEKYYSKNGIEEFLVFLSIETHRDEEFLIKIKDVLIDNYNDYDFKNENLNFVILDFIARQYEPNVAFNAIKKIKYNNNSVEKIDYIIFGMDCLIKEIRHNVKYKALLDKAYIYMNTLINTCDKV